MVEKAQYLMRHGGINDSSVVIDDILSMTKGAAPPDLAGILSAR